ncbi:restriction endonuclease subunit S [Acidithiobacillus ferrooxidans]|uniref:restriction endonuclease subunit S n=1 Tax=Acidithiobacillus ferrooxidans TaxID=920 RepID=UPI0013D4ED1D|nr:restriction endonuclease subunit S [Acidithiobacillus ferrooxidans]MCR2832099.1 restriction endonuclease subunit S [Acidithiobacillus ferrooxidans]MDA8119012.1 restriction endonuclease subunit S [Gammaproteobacteria bacterium]
MRDSNLLIEPLPPGWNNRQFGDVCDRVKDSYQPVDDGDTPYVGLEHLAQGFPAFVGRGKESEVTSSKTAFKAGDILFGKLRPYLRKGAQADFDGVCSTDILAFRAKAACESEFLKFIIHSDEFVAHAKSTTSGVQHPRTSWPSLREFRLSLPPLPEQKKIAHILSTVQRAIEAQERIIQTTTELKKALMHKLFTEGLRNEPQKQTEIGPIPESWTTPTVESVCTIKSSAMSYSQLEKAPSVSIGVRVIGIKVSDMNLPGNEIEVHTANLERQLPEKEALKRTVPANSIVFPKRGAAIATNKKRLTTGYTVLDPNLIAVMPTKAVNHRYLFHWFNTFDLKKITDPGPTPQLNKKDIAPLKFPMPPLEDQEAIAAAIDTVEEKTTLHSRKLDQLQDLFRTLLHEMMTAKTRVHELEVAL